MATNSEQEFIERIQKHSGIIHKIIHLYVDDLEDQRDLHQEILLQAWKSFAQFRGDARFSTWLYKVSLNTALTFQRKQTRQAKLAEISETIAEDSSEQADRSDLLYRLVRQLHQVDRMIMTLHLEGYKNGEIAEITGLTLNHINVKLHRLKNQIINQLGMRN
ncbi:MAG: sigma-70 family RNA polymerase sigma factor [Bacteroidota bacterium]